MFKEYIWYDWTALYFYNILLFNVDFSLSSQKMSIKMNKNNEGIEIMCGYKPTWCTIGIDGV